jgi:hypothetical protein
MLGEGAQWRGSTNLEALGELLQHNLSVAQKGTQAEVAETLAQFGITLDGNGECDAGDPFPVGNERCRSSRKTSRSAEWTGAVQGVAHTSERSISTQI